MDEFISNKMKAAHVPGLAVGIVKQDRIARVQGYGWANIERQIPMTPETVINIGSITKTVTATALMQLWEQGKFALEDDINHYLPFPVRNPFHPKTAITFQHLLTHTSSIRDGAAYRASYTCGDPTISLRSWLQAYLTAEGSLYHPQESFYEWKPGARFSYANVGFGVLGYLVEKLSGTSFAEYCRTRIFEPLGMHKTCWYLADLQRTEHAVPYTYVSDGNIHSISLKDPSWSYRGSKREEYVPHCLYSFPNLSDGLLRTNVSEFARFLMAYLNDGKYGNTSILESGTIREMLNEERAKTQRLGVPGVGTGIYGLGWYAQQLSRGELVWGHAGGDPGISTLMFARFADRVGTIVFANAYEENGARYDITEYLFHHATE
jgi:CubicO group peptidase (beta-lactamase class C family)